MRKNVLAADLVACGTLAFPQSGPTVDQRVDDLLKQMTTEEKIGQLSQLFDFGDPKPIEAEVAKGHLGSLLFVTDPAVINRFQHMAVEQTRLHIPLIFGFDVIHGFRTIFPVPIAMAASWDPAGALKAQTIAAREARAVGIHWAFAPMLDIARDPRWGRMVEGAGEDPYLGAAMAAAQVRGFQGEAIGSPEHLLATMKHFAGYGAAEGGRDYDASYISEAQLRNVYLPPFEAAVKAGVGSVMSAYMDLNDVPATGNRWLMHDVLRDEWKFQGFVVSDANAVKSLVTHGFAKDERDATVRALNAGVDMEMAIGATAYSTNLAAALKAGDVTLKQIEDADRNILAMKFRMGLFEHPYVDEAAAAKTLATPEHRTAARVAAERSAVLLRNEGGLLPLKKGAYSKIAVVGPLADSQVDTLGSWAFQEDLTETVTVMAGLRTNAITEGRVTYAQGVQISRKFPSFFDEIFKLKQPAPWNSKHETDEFNKAASLARASDLTILVLGEAQNMSGEAASRDSLSLPGRQEELMKAVTALGKPVVLVLMNGRPLDLRFAADRVPAILEVWYPGTQGGTAVANLLSGEAVPGGKLPFTWPRSEGQIPINYSHNTTQAPEEQGKRYWAEESTPLYPFGFGLSYSKFSFSNLKVAGRIVTAQVENTGTVAADEVAQLYIHQKYGGASRPVRELKGFERVTHAPHERKTVGFEVKDDDLKYWSAAKKAWVLESSMFDVWVGADSTATLAGSFSN